MRLVIALAALVAACSTPAQEATPAQDLLTAPVAGQLALPWQLDLLITRSELIAGRWVDFVVIGATPGAQVGIAVSNGVRAPGSCLPWIGGCLDITPGTSGYTFVLFGVADARGTVVFPATLPRGFATGPWIFQALSPSGAGGAYVGSAPVVRDVLPFRTNCVRDDGFENDDSGPFASPISMGHRSTDRVLCNEDDIDWHSIDMTAGQAIAVDVTFEHDEGDLDVYVVDVPTSNNMSVLDRNFLARGYSVDDNENITFTAPVDGTYYLGVRQVRDNGAYPGNTYDLDVTELPDACTIDFEDAYADSGHGGNPADYYAPFGVDFFQTSGFGLIGGEINGDPGGWTEQAGVVPNAAWGCWDDTNAEINTIAFAAPVRDVSFVAYAGPFHTYQTLSVEGFLGGVSTGVELFTIHDVTTPFATPTLAGPVDAVQLYVPNGPFAYIIDDITYRTDSFACP